MNDSDLDSRPILGHYELELEDDPPILPNVTVPDVLEQLKEAEEWTERSDVISDGSVRWRPHLWSDDKTQVLHVHLVDELRTHVKDRLKMAAEVGVQVVVALQLKALYRHETIELLAIIDAKVMMLDAEGEITVAEGDNLLTVLSDLSVPVSQETRTRIARLSWQNRTVGTSFDKGRRFEGLIAFLLDQVNDFRVIERNYRGETDELDIVVQIDNWSTRCWQLEGAPFLLVEAKNWTAPVDQPAVTVFNSKLRTRRQTARLGLMFAASRFTSEAKLQLLKFAQDREVIALICGDQIVQWIDSTEPEDYLEGLVRNAMLR